MGTYNISHLHYIKRWSSLLHIKHGPFFFSFSFSIDLRLLVLSAVYIMALTPMTSYTSYRSACLKTEFCDAACQEMMYKNAVRWSQAFQSYLTLTMLEIHEQEEVQNYYYWSLLYSTILRSRADSLRSHVILHEWIAFYGAFLNIHRSGVLTALAWLVPQESAARES